MEGFLREVAGDLYGRYGDGVSGLSVIFPSRRARLFFTDALSQIADKPLWQPEWLTVDDLMTEVSGLREGDRVRLVTELYTIYAEYHAEPFDKFYFWGELLINDFDTIDKYLIDADRLFRNISDLKELEADMSYLTPEQLGILRAFWSSLIGDGDLSDEKQKFLAVWRTLAEIYHRFRARLTELGVAYTGMIQRAAAERFAAGGFAFDRERHYVVAGFNALSECEKRLFKFLATNAQAEFFWDYDNYYLKNPEQEAGLFVRENLRMFPPCAELSHDTMRQPKRLTSVAASSDAVQCKQAANILGELMHNGPLGKETAVVLTDENLLLPVLFSLPETVGKVNVTMGYPLRQSLAYTFTERLLELQKHCRKRGLATHFYHADVTGILMHPYVANSDSELVYSLQGRIVAERRITIDASALACSELLSLLFVPADGWRGLSLYLSDVIAAVARIPYEGDDARRRVEFLAVIAEHIAKLRNSLEACDVEISPEVFASLLRRTLQNLRIPYEGEPLEGVQVMGILETRNLDFENVLILSMTDDNFPGNLLSQPSFIPYNLRMAYGLPTPEHHEGVYAYYFYRLIQRAKNVWMLYCSRADDKSTGEPSRYIYQLGYESGFPVQKTEVGVDVNLSPPCPIEIMKDAGIVRRLKRFTTASDEPATLSPTAFSRYVACPLKFYFYSVARIKPDEELTEEVDNPLFGTLLHDAVQRLYEQVRGEANPGAVLQALVAAGRVEQAVLQAVNANCLCDPDASEADYTGNLLIVRDIVIRYIRYGIIRYDAEHDGFSVRGLEEEVSYEFPFESGGKSLSVKFAGRADRIDLLNGGVLRVVDYKTGTPHLEYKGVEALFCGKAGERLPNILQTLLYAMMLYRTEGRDVIPALYYVREMHREDYSPALVDRANPAVEQYTSVCESFEEQVRQQLSELFDPAMPFRQCEDADTCKYCDFKAICRR